MSKIFKNKKVLAGLGLGVVGALAGAATYIIGGMVYEETVGYVSPHFQDTDAEYIYRDMPEVLEEYTTYETRAMMIPSSNGYDVEAEYITAKNPSDQTVVMIHGIGQNMYRHLREALMYLRNDFNVVIYNQRYTGETGGDNRSFGYYEQHDLAAVVDYVKAENPDHQVGAHGFSMGAGTAAMYSGHESAQEQVDYIILDCPYDTMKGAIGVGIAAEGYPIPTSYAVWAGDFYNNIKSGFDYDDARPIDGVAKSTMPMYIIHGEADTTCTVDMGQALYDAKDEGYKEIWIEPETEHVRIFDDHPDAYEANVMAFISNIE